MLSWVRRCTYNTTYPVMRSPFSGAANESWYRADRRRPNRNGPQKFPARVTTWPTIALLCSSRRRQFLNCLEAEAAQLPAMISRGVVPCNPLPDRFGCFGWKDCISAADRGLDGFRICGNLSRHDAIHQRQISTAYRASSSNRQEQPPCQAFAPCESKAQRAESTS